MTERYAEEIKTDLSRMKDDLGHLFSNIQELVKKEAGFGFEKVQSASQNIQEKITEKPLMSIAVCFSVGFLIGKFLFK